MSGPAGPAPGGPPADPILARRAQIRRVTSLGQRAGALAYLAATVVLVVALATGFPAGTATAVVVLLVGGSIVLAPSILVAYMVKAAERDEREATDPRHAR